MNSYKAAKPCFFSPGHYCLETNMEISSLIQRMTTFTEGEPLGITLAPPPRGSNTGGWIIETGTYKQQNDPFSGRTLIHWEEIRLYISTAQMRGNVHMVQRFYDSLFTEGLFDDRGVWCLKLKPPSVK
jgi:hypothetical protein